MPRKPRSLKQEMDRLSGRLREEGRTWVEIAALFRERWGLNSRQAFREAHRFTQARVVEIWNGHWPDQPLTVRKLGAWEAAPGPTGNEPSLTCLNRLARVYQCRAVDLIDGADHRGDDEHTARRRSARNGGDGPLVLRIADIREVLSEASGYPSVTAEPVAGLRDTEFERLVQALAALALKMKRRDVLALMGAAATAAYASPLLTGLDEDALARVASVAADPSRVDLESIAHIETVLEHARRQEDRLGPGPVLDTVLAQHRLVRSLLAPHPAGDVRVRLLSLLAGICRVTGWMLFNLNDFRGADHYYAQARGFAHEAGDDAMCSMVLANWSQLATWRGDPRLGIEHALSAVVWGRRAGSKLLVSYGNLVGARGHAALARRSAKSDRRPDRAHCLRALDHAHRELRLAAEDDPGGHLTHFYSAAQLVSTQTKCLLDLGDAMAALPLAQRSVQDLGPAFVRNRAFARLDLARAYTQARELEAACAAIGQAGELARRNTSPRLVQSVADARQALSPWAGTRPVAALDDRLRALA